ncbi:hypothetical protein MIR68_007813 [Amoeboaphelidium protococcarum]|nr:hypothetical protein MIR68_007813 [Amoeboaphelidium protococcarum]
MTVDSSLETTQCQHEKRSLEKRCFGDTTFIFNNRVDDQRDIQSYEFSGKDLEKFGKDNVLLTLAQTCVENSTIGKRKYIIDLKADTDQFTAQHVDNMMNILLDPGSLETFNFDEEMENQDYMANVLDYYNIQLPQSPFSVGSSLFQKARVYLLEQHQLKCKVQEAAFKAFLTAMDKVDFGKMADGVFGNGEGAMVVVTYDASGEGEICFQSEDYESEEIISGLPEYSNLASYKLAQLVKELETMLHTRFVGKGLVFETKYQDDDEPWFLIRAYLQMEFFKRIQSYITCNQS